MAFLDKLESLRIKRGVSKNKLCADIGVNKNAIANWENRQNVPDGEVLARIAAYFNVTVDYLVDKEPSSELESERPVENEILELAHDIINLSPENKARMKDYLDLLKKQDNS